MASAGTLPNLLIIGAAKAGTTSLHGYLQRHPQAYMSALKEPRYFAYDGEVAESFAGPDASGLIEAIVKTQADYERLFDEAEDARVVGESSPAYLYSPTAPARIHKTVPSAKLVVALRDPAERAYSHWVDNVGAGWEPVLDFEQALDLADQRQRENWWRKWDYIGHGYYAEQLSRYLQLFPREQIKVLLFEDLKGDPDAVIRELLLFLELDPTLEHPGIRRENAGGVPRSRTLAAVASNPNALRTTARRLLPRSLRARVRREIAARNVHKPAMAPSARMRLVETYRRDIDLLADLIGRDLSSWLRP
jgi:hypothetical protein